MSKLTTAQREKLVDHYVNRVRTIFEVCEYFGIRFILQGSGVLVYWPLDIETEHPELVESVESLKPWIVEVIHAHQMWNQVTHGKASEARD